VRSFEVLLMDKAFTFELLETGPDVEAEVESLDK